MSRVTRFRLLAAIVLAAPLAAQRTWIVDRSNGAGTDFTDLPAALIAAHDGDTIVCRPGDYSGATTAKGLTLLGGPGVTLNSVIRRTLTINLTVGQTFVLKGFSADFSALPPPTNVPPVSVQGSGRVHMEDLDLVANDYSAGFYSNQYGALTLVGVRATGSPGFHMAGSGGPAATRCIFTGRPGPFPHGFYGGGNVTLSFCTISGQIAAQFNSTTHEPVVIAGDSTSTFSGSGGWGILWNGSGLTIDPSVRVQATYPFSGTPIFQRLPAMDASGAAPGQSIFTTLYSPSGDLVILLASIPDFPFAAPPFGTLWLDPTAIFYVTAAVQAQSEHWLLQLPIPSFAPRGLPIALQGLSGPGLDVKLTNPVVVVLN